MKAVRNDNNNNKDNTIEYLKKKKRMLLTVGSTFDIPATSGDDVGFPKWTSAR